MIRNSLKSQKTKNLAVSKMVVCFTHYIWGIVHPFQLKMFIKQDQNYRES